MSRFLLRCTFVATCVALSSSAAIGQSDSTIQPRVADAGAPLLAAPTLMLIPERAGPIIAPPTIAPPVIAAATIDPLRAVNPVNEDVSSVVRRRAPFSRPAVLMITGGALLLTGLLVDGDASSILIIAGAGIGGYGLYLHLQSPNARLRRF